MGIFKSVIYFIRALVLGVGVQGMIENEFVIAFVVALALSIVSARGD